MAGLGSATREGAVFLGACHPSLLSVFFFLPLGRGFLGFFRGPSVGGVSTEGWFRFPVAAVAKGGLGSLVSRDHSSDNPSTSFLH